MAVGGDITEITYNHPTIGSGVFYPKAGTASTFNLGGFRVADESNGIDGSGTMIAKMNRERWSFEGVIANDMNNAKDLENAVALASNPVPADWTFTHINGAIYGGKGMPVGDIKADGNEATFSLKVAGGGILKQ
jgi:hypothetical protein